MAELAIFGGKTSIVPDELVERLSRFKWHADRHGYATRHIRTPIKRVKSYLSREVLSAKIGRPLIKGELCDHINGNILDNRFENLRVASYRGNVCNRAKCKKTSSPYKGIFWVEKERKWKSQIQCNGKLYYLGTFKDAESAALAYDAAAIKYHGEFARLNFK